MNKCLAPLMLLAASLSIGLSACQSGAPETPPLAGARMGGAFTLTTQDGARLSDVDLKGKYRLVYFGYTFCPDVCPVDVQKLMAGFRAFEAFDPALAAKTQPLFITVDPERDTPPVLKQFVSAFHPRLIGLTGTPAEIAAVAKLYAVSYEKEPGVTPGAYLVNHSRMTVLYGPAGEAIALIPQDGSAAAIAAELKRWIR
jgi:protein SCO1